MSPGLFLSEGSPGPQPGEILERYRFRELSRAPLVFAVLVFLAACGPEPIVETTSEIIEIDSVDLPGSLWDPFMPPLSEGEPVVIEGQLTLPPTEGPVPLVIVTHGCGGVGQGEMGWISFLERKGLATLLVDSFGGRDIESICSGAETVNVASILVDVFRAAEAIRDNPYVDKGRIAILGLSFGGRTALWTAMTRFQDIYDGRGFQAHLALYPSTCFIQLEGEVEVSEGPIRIFHGTADDWTPIEQCQDYIRRLTEAGVDAGLFAYEGAQHAFDNSSIQSAKEAIFAVSPRQCAFVEEDGAIIDTETGELAGTGSACVQFGVHVGYDEKARDMVRADLLAVLHETFGDW